MSLADEIRQGYMLRREQIYSQAPEFIEDIQEVQHVEDKRAKLKALQRQLEMRLRKSEPTNLGVGEVEGYEGGMFNNYIDSMMPQRKTISFNFDGEALSSINFG